MLLLRQTCQPILDSYGLSELHVVIQDKTLTIVGSCGKPLVAIGGITFSKSSISEKERTFATELFETFMVKYSADIIKYVTEKKAFAALPELILPKDFMLNSSYSNYCLQIDPGTYQGMIIKIDPTGQMSVSTDKLTFTPNIIVELIQAVAKGIPDCIAYLTEHESRRNTANTLDSQRATLAKCDI
jgi:hypothetical protein